MLAYSVLVHIRVGFSFLITHHKESHIINKHPPKIHHNHFFDRNSKNWGTAPMFKKYLLTSCYSTKICESSTQKMDVVWLKRDIRLHDHGPFEEISKSNNPFCIIYLFEPDQLSEPTVHGSHVCFINESLVDLDLLLSGASRSDDDDATKTNNNNDVNVTSRTCNNISSNYTFQTLTVCHANAVYTFDLINRQTKINRILCHQETGHYKSFIRDKTVRKWCKKQKLEIIEYNQSGVTRCLKDRDDFATKLNEFLMKPLYNSIDTTIATLDDDNKSIMTTQTKKIYMITHACKHRLVTTLQLHRRIHHPIDLQTMSEIPVEHRVDRIDRQIGGETKALETLNTFLSSRGSFYAGGISSPNTSWNSCSRLSPYLAWGNISLRFVIQKTREKQCYLREEKKEKQKLRSKITTIHYTPPTSSKQDEYWLKSLQAFSSRIHWRSHFIQKLESEPLMEKQDLCPAYQHLRRQPNDFNQDYYNAWSTGHTGFPFLDACMRCLEKHGWLNFRMRAMVVSFATYNLWLDWKRIAPHLARLFLDYEPGIHYPQLQMQSGTTGINAMRVYNVTKQGKDQDPDGVFIRKYVEELKNVPLEYIHEPSKMPKKLQEKLQVYIVKSPSTLLSCDKDDNDTSTSTQQPCLYYPKPIVDEQSTAKQSKDKIAEVRNQESTKKLASQVYIKHGSRNNSSNRMEKRNRDGTFITTSSGTGTGSGNNSKLMSKKMKDNENDKIVNEIGSITSTSGQRKITDLFVKCEGTVGGLENNDIIKKQRKNESCTGISKQIEKTDIGAIDDRIKDSKGYNQKEEKSVDLSKGNGPCSNNILLNYVAKKKGGNEKVGWHCKACTYLNDKPLGLSCSICGTLR